jgi:hypothetical protein
MGRAREKQVRGEERERRAGRGWADWTRREWAELVKWFFTFYSFLKFK